jgi:hypothetical protein
MRWRTAGRGGIVGRATYPVDSASSNSLPFAVLNCQVPMKRRAFDNDGSWTIELEDSFARTEAGTDDSPLCIVFTDHDKSVSGSFFELWNGEWRPDPRPPEFSSTVHGEPYRPDIVAARLGNGQLPAVG